MCLQTQSFPLDINLFNEETKLFISLISQFLGLDTDRYVTKLLMSLSFRTSTSQYELQSSQSLCLKFDELISKSINSHLVNFYSTKHFRFQSYLVRMFLFFNEENLQLPKMVLIDEINCNLFKYMNFLMVGVYKAFSKINYLGYYQ